MGVEKRRYLMNVLGEMVKLKSQPENSKARTGPRSAARFVVILMTG